MGITDALEDFKLCGQCQLHIADLSKQILSSLKEKLGNKTFAELRNCGVLGNLLFAELEGAIGIKYAYEEAIKAEYS